MSSKSKKENEETVLVIAVLGGPASGKTTLCSSLTGIEPDYNDHLPREYRTLVKKNILAIIFKELHLDEEFHDVNRKELKKSDGVIGVFNTTDMHSLEIIARSLQKIQNDAKIAKPIAVIAMNSQSPQREVLPKVGQTTTRLLGIPYLEDNSPNLKSEVMSIVQRVEPRDIAQLKRKHKTKVSTSPKKETSPASSRADKSKSLPRTNKDFESLQEIQAQLNKLKQDSKSVPTSPANSRPSTVRIAPQVITFGRYEITRVIGSGIEGRVYQATDKETRQVVALKEPNDGDVESQEKIMRELDHPNIIKCFGTFTDTPTGKKFIVMEYMKDGSLLELIKTHPSLGQDDIIAILRQIAAALHYMEQKKVLHRDIALRNVLVNIEQDGRWTVKMGDFGLARQSTRTDSSEYEMLSKLRPLPLNQIPPECTHTRKWNPKCEAWSFGILMWELLSRGQTPYKGIQEEVFKFLEQGKRLGRPKDCPDKLWRIMKQCWHQDPEQRPSFSELALLLTESPYGWMPAMAPQPIPPKQESPYGEMPSGPKLMKTLSLQQMVESMAVPNSNTIAPFQRSTSLPTVTNEQDAANDSTPYQPVPFVPPVEVTFDAPRVPDVIPQPQDEIPPPPAEIPMVEDIPAPPVEPQPPVLQSAPQPAVVTQIVAPVQPPTPLQPSPAQPPVLQSAPQYIPQASPPPVPSPQSPPQYIPQPVTVQLAASPPAPSLVLQSAPQYIPQASPLPVQPQSPSQYNPQPVITQSPPVLQSAPQYIPEAVIYQIATPPTTVHRSAPSTPVVSRPSSPVQTSPMPRSLEYAIFHDGVEHCAVESLTPEMTLEKAREVLSDEVDFDIAKCNFFRTDTNQRIAFKQEKSFTVQKCTNNAMVIHLRTTVTS